MVQLLSTNTVVRSALRCSWKNWAKDKASFPANMFYNIGPWLEYTLGSWSRQFGVVARRTSAWSGSSFFIDDAMSSQIDMAADWVPLLLPLMPPTSTSLWSISDGDSFGCTMDDGCGDGVNTSAGMTSSSLRCCTRVNWWCCCCWGMWCCCTWCCCCCCCWWCCKWCCCCECCCCCCCCSS